ncbi:MAG: histidine kinase N-terminal domain-containing protein [Fusobacteriaceae bacterium]
MIRNYCKMCTTLTTQDINKIQKLKETAIILSNVLGVDTFIDCPTNDNEKALVIHHSKPEKESLYSKNIAGETAFYKNEPAVLRTLQTGLPSKNYKAITQEGENVLQNVIAIKNESNEIIGVLILEQLNKNLIEVECLKNPEELMSNFLESTDKIPELIKDGIVIFNDKEVVTYANKVAKSIYEKIGFKDNIIGEYFTNIVINSIKFNNILQNNKIDVVEVAILDMVLSVSYFATLENKKNKNVIMIIRDITV